MKTGTKHFLLGLVTGLAGAVVVAVMGIVVGSRVYGNYVKSTIEERIAPPPVPESLDADYAWQAATPGGPPMPMAILRDKVVVLTFWNPDCFSCTEQLEYIQALSNQVKDVPVEFAAVSIGTHETTQEEISKLGVELPVYVLEGARPEVFKTKTLPTTFVLTAGGKIAYRYGGIARWDDPAVVSYLRALAAEATPERQ